MAKKKLKITKEQILKMNRKVRREEDIANNSTGWVRSHAVHASKKTYNRKKKHK